VSLACKPRLLAAAVTRVAGSLQARMWARVLQLYLRGARVARVALPVVHFASAIYGCRRSWAERRPEWQRWRRGA
jgi:hypothetical protein